ncbi:TetR/AcrR family transcriptional regulator [Mycobacterium sp. shizuoka-1]|uniref:TetR/AcrR family transcriptional regulator n=1 Tax=Mycobacterium sp. shizuoka-1 TaxID=2039281 RepID=UPI000C064169|nr:TetR/AcrR family transcriptional regulator [Mycobacterium sp. shizuoka-1]GAY13827.1 TetR family transcriptional regulator [Mycobacterium sp. shizuoka-1]
MRTHGWGGQTPRTDDEAVQRILDAARRAIDTRGADMRIADVARDLGVTRQTVYRYFPSTEDLLMATAVSETAPFLDALADHVAGISDPAAAVTEAIAHTLEQLPNQKYLGIVFASKPSGQVFAAVTSAVSQSFGRSMVQRFDVDWAAAGFTGDTLDGLVEFMLRILMSFVVDPGHPRRTADELRGFLHEWVSPAIAHHARRAPVHRTRH